MSWFGLGGSGKRDADEEKPPIENDGDGGSPSRDDGGGALAKLKAYKLPRMNELDLQAVLLLAGMLWTAFREVSGSVIRKYVLPTVGKLKDRILEGEEDIPSWIPASISARLGADKKTRKKNICAAMAILAAVVLLILASGGGGTSAEVEYRHLDDGVSPIPRHHWKAPRLRGVIMTAEDICNGARSRLGGPARLEACVQQMAAEHAKMLKKLGKVPR